MLKRLFTSLLVLALLFIFPHQGLAVEFSITNVKMDAYLQTSGDVKVEETHTYEFEGEFNGITREVVPKEGAVIRQFTAAENGHSLRVEKEDDFYKVHRKGTDETITITLNYTIENGMEIYRDAAQFYWPFFDERNESSYEDLTITIHPPAATDDVIAFGYGEAFNTETIQEDGTILFELGYVPSGMNGDIRVAYPAALFPTATKTADKPMKEEILKAKQKLIEQAAVDAKTKETLSTISMIGLPSFTIILLLFMMRDWLRTRALRNDFMREGITFTSVPKQIMSLPATIYFTNNNYLQPQAMAAALLDLVRQRYVMKTADDQFQRIRSKSPFKHENILMELLFDKIGANQIFSLDDLTTYTKNTKNQVKYNSYQLEWKQAVKQEVDNHSLFENKTTYRSLIGFSSILLLPFLFFFLLYGLIVSFMVTLLLVITVIIYASVYRSKTREGARIAYEWRQFKAHFKDLPQTEWEKWSEDDRMRAYIYGLGISSKEIDRKNDALIEALIPTGSDYVDDSSFYSILYIGPYTSSSFHSAYQSSTRSSGGSDSGGGNGGGTSGGGGGSGAF
ncbi:DUF2207 domain-containing protein [Neobacillus niacini]|uniref:DUF2207 domain-containing protein n=1 Tax=Neobacillus niacini TaxID=86668 RepID=UPI00052F5D65|nr:DUF2207 domain-containing protein [Neobacillus niacini]KGM46002.1 hypothetical protein NP83_02770 [Neobacillus niacini]MEC1522038.1 DUF2207 domain-containing protein [Neobacillus niacini]